MTNRLPLLIIILFASCLVNLIIPYAIYIKKYGLFKKRKKGFIGVNAWGIIMDGILAGSINIIALNYLLVIKPLIYQQDLLLAGITGTSLMTICHIYMSLKKWKIWIMDRPWKWNLAGYWHMVSMSLQMSFLAYSIIILIKNPVVFTNYYTQISVLLILSLAFLFVLALRLQTKGLRIGKFYISKEPW